MENAKNDIIRRHPSTRVTGRNITMDNRTARREKPARKSSLRARLFRLSLMALAALAFALLTGSSGARGEILYSGSQTMGGSWVVDWSIDDEGLLTISGKGGIYDTSYAWMFYQDEILSLRVEDGVTNLGDSFFKGLVNLKSVSMADSVTSAGSNLFDGCTSLETVALSENLAKLSSRMFYGCTSLKQISVPDSVTSMDPGVFSGCTALESIRLSENLAAVPVSAFSGLSSLKSITLPNSVQSIGQYAFDGCTSLESVTLSSGLTSLPSYLFSGLKNLKSLSIPTGVAQVGEKLCMDCTALKNVTLPSGLAVIPNYMFSGCTSLQSITLPGQLTTIENNAFHGCTALVSVRIPDSVSTIDEYAFDGCQSLRTVTFGSGLRSVGNRAFAYTDLRSVSMPGTVTSFGTSVFEHCTALASAVLPNGLTSVPSATFAYCSSLASVSWPDTVTRIGDRAFYGCTALTGVSFGSAVTEIGVRAFYQTALAAFAPTGNIASIGDYAFYQCPSLETVNLSGCSLTAVPEYAFSYCGALHTLLLPDALESIGTYAFASCSSLKEVSFGSSLQEIGREAFLSTGLTGVQIPDSVETLGNGTFSGCQYLRSATLGSGLTSLPDSVFSAANLEEIRIPAGITSVGKNAFSTNNHLKYAEIKGTSVTFGSDAFPRKRNNELFCTTFISVPAGSQTFSNLKSSNPNCLIVQRTSSGMKLTSALSGNAGSRTRLYALSGQTVSLSNKQGYTVKEAHVYLDYPDAPRNANRHLSYDYVWTVTDNTLGYSLADAYGAKATVLLVYQNDGQDYCSGPYYVSFGVADLTEPTILSPVFPETKDGYPAVPSALDIPVSWKAVSDDVYYDVSLFCLPSSSSVMYLTVPDGIQHNIAGTSCAVPAGLLTASDLPYMISVAAISKTTGEGLRCRTGDFLVEDAGASVSSEILAPADECLPKASVKVKWSDMSASSYTVSLYRKGPDDYNEPVNPLGDVLPYYSVPVKEISGITGRTCTFSGSLLEYGGMYRIVLTAFMSDGSTREADRLFKVVGAPESKPAVSGMVCSGESSASPSMNIRRGTLRITWSGSGSPYYSALLYRLNSNGNKEALLESVISEKPSATVSSRNISAGNTYLLILREYDSDLFSNEYRLYFNLANPDSVNTLITPSGLETIDTEAFAGCSEVRYIRLTGSPTAIGDMAFSGCENLAFIDIPSSVTSFGQDLFLNCPLRMIYCRKNSPAWNWAVSQGLPVTAASDVD